MADGHIGQPHLEILAEADQQLDRSLADVGKALVHPGEIRQPLLIGLVQETGHGYADVFRHPQGISGKHLDHRPQAFRHVGHHEDVRLFPFDPLQKPGRRKIVAKLNLQPLEFDFRGGIKGGQQQETLDSPVAQDFRRTFRRHPLAINPNEGSESGENIDKENAFLSYATLTTRALGAEGRFTAWPGIAMAQGRGYTGTIHMPAAWLKAVPMNWDLPNSPNWDFA